LNSPTKIFSDRQTRIFIQARLGSKRLPRKMLAKLGEMTLLEWVLYRLKKASQANNIHLLTSREPGNELLAEIANGLNIDTFFGEESDVASRFSEAARRWPADNYVRVCADNPFICPQEIDNLIKYHIEGGFDYSFNHIPALDNHYVDGFGAEIFRSNLMDHLSSKVLTDDEKEHVTRYFWNRRDEYKFGVMKAPESLRHPALSFDIDTKSDFLKFQKVVEIVSPDMTGDQILDVLKNAKKLELFAHEM
jgi:spore coat polysaccharide biosynthesis protein SpsF